MKNFEIICGIDEAGRGCVAGDLVMAGVVLTADIKGLNDSKKLTPKKRQELFDVIKAHSHHHIVTITSAQIDELGLSKCLTQGLVEILNHLAADEYIFDGNSSFGIEKIKTMIKADSQVAQVAAASILAKVTHDNNIARDALIYPEYEFEKHKGYVTKRHLELIREFGYCSIHRKSYKLKL